MQQAIVSSITAFALSSPLCTAKMYIMQPHLFTLRRMSETANDKKQPESFAKVPDVDAVQGVAVQ